MNGLDCLVFTGGIGENSASIRAQIAGGLESFGVYLDVPANSALRGEGIISTPDSPVKVAVIKADEELVVARQAAALLRSSDS